MTDLRHIAQLLHEAGVSEGLGPTAMATWLGRRIHDAARDTENEERARRLESDAEAVQVITIHRSKGLEFPIVYCPATWDGRGSTVGRAGVPRPGPGQPADHRRGPRGQRLQQAPEARTRGGSGRGPPLALRRADPGLSPGHRLVGRRHGQPAFAAGPTALRPGPRRTRPALRGQGAQRRRGRGGGPRPRSSGGGRAGGGTARGAVAGRSRRSAQARGGAFRPHARHRMATGLVLEHHGGLSRPTGHRQRTRAAVHLRRGGPGSPGARRGGTDTPGRGGACRGPRSGRHAGRCLGRDGRAQRLRATRLRGARPGRGGRRGPRARDHLAQCRSRWDRGGRGRVVRGHRVAARSAGRRHRSARHHPPGPPGRADLRDPTRGRGHAGHHAARGRGGRPARIPSPRARPGGPLRQPSPRSVPRTPCCAAT